MIPTFLRPEVFPYTSVELLPAEVSVEHLLARKTDSVAFCPTCDGYAFLGHVCPGEHDADQDPHPHDDYPEDFGSTCGSVCGYCGMCS